MPGKRKVGYTRRAHSSLARPGEVYRDLLYAYVARYNWAYADRMADLPLIRQAFLFTLYLLHKYRADVESVVVWEPQRARLRHSRN